MDEGTNLSFGPFTILVQRRELLSHGEPLTLGTRPFDVLLALVRRRGQLVTKDELMAEVWPGVVVDEHNLNVQVSTVRKILGDGIGGQRYVLTVPGRGYRFVAPVSDASASPAPQATIGSPSVPGTPKDEPVSHNLPTQLVRLIGREDDLREIESRLRSYRLVTITGAGGVGKTSISIAAGESSTSDFPGGIWFVDLASLREQRDLPETLARTIGLQAPDRSAALKVISAYFRSRKALLILYNCEHLLDGVAELAEFALRGSDRVSILCTSREPLKIAGEIVYPLRPLSVPSAGSASPEILNCGSVQLFLERSAACGGEPAPTEENCHAIGAICRRLDGVPFAIELAAAWSRMYTPPQLDVALTNDFRILRHRGRGGVSHHRTLLALLDWSYGLLNGVEQQTLCELSVFAGTFSAESVTAVVSCGREDQTAALETLASLIDKSLVVVEPEPVERRYRLLETTRRYAGERYRQAGAGGAEQRLGCYLLSLFQEAERLWPTLSTPAWRTRYEPELENVRAALTWAFDAAGDEQLGVHLAAVCAGLWEELGLVSERLRWLRRADEAVTDETPLAAAGRIRLALAFQGIVGQRRNEAELNELVAVARSLGDPFRLALALRMVAALHMQPNDTNYAEACLSQAAAMLRPFGHSKPLAGILDIWAIARRFAGDPIGSHMLAEEALEMARSVGYPRQIEMTMLNLADLEFEEGQPEQALAHAEEAIAACRESGNLRGLCILLSNVAGYQLAVGRVQEAGQSAREGLQLARSIENESTAICCIEHLCLVLCLAGSSETAAMIAGYCDEYYRAQAKTRYGVEAATRESIEAGLGSALQSTELDRLFRTGAFWTLETAAKAAALC